MRLLAGELSQREIGAQLYVSFNTVKSHTRSIFRKLGVTTGPARSAAGASSACCRARTPTLGEPPAG